MSRGRSTPAEAPIAGAPPPVHVTPPDGAGSADEVAREDGAGPKAAIAPETASAAATLAAATSAVATKAAAAGPPLLAATALTAGPSLLAGERVLATESDGNGSSVVATTQGLLHGVDGAWKRLPWEEIGRVGWDGQAGALTMSRLVHPEAGDLRVTVPRRSPLVALVHERVTASVLATVRIPLPDGRVGVITGRRRPGTDEVFWVVVLPDGVDADHPDVAARVAAAIRWAGAEAGLR
jgi:hypothetical protein